MHSEKSHRNAGSPLQRKMETTASATPPSFELQASPVQKKEGNPGGGSAAQNNSGGLPNEVRAKMEASMGADFSNVKVNANSSKAEEAGALAYAQGNELHFASGQYDPGSQKGQELIGHELAHVKQQQEGRVKATGSVGGMALNDDKGLENEADRLGTQAAQTKVDPNAAPVQQKSAGGSSSSSNAPVQRFKMRPSDINRYPKFAAFIQNEIPKSGNDARLTKYLKIFGTNEGETARDIQKDLQWDQGPEIRPYQMSKSDVSFRSNEKAEIIRLNRQDIEFFEKSPENQQKLNDRVIEANVLNGYTQFLDDQDGKDKWGKEGDEFEEKTFGEDIHSTWEARRSSRASFGQGEWEVTVLEAQAGMTQRLKVWNTVGSNGRYEATPGTSFTVTARPMNNWNFLMEHNAAGMDAQKGWMRNDMVTTQESEGHFTVRSDFDGDNDRNDLVVSVKKKK